MDSFNFDRTLAVIKKEFIHIRRDIRSLIVATLAPVFLLIIYGYAVTFDIKKIDVAIIDYNNTYLSRALIQKFDSLEYFELHKNIKNINDAKKDLKLNKIKLILIIPSEFSKMLKKGKKVKIQFIGDGTEPNTLTVAYSYTKVIISKFSHEIIFKKLSKRGIDTKKILQIQPSPRVWYNPELKSQKFIVPGIIAILMMLISATLTSLTIVREKELGTFEQVISTPVTSIELMIGKLTPYILIGIIDSILVIIIGSLWFKVPIRGNILSLFIFILLFVFNSMGMGLFISSVSKTQTSAVIITLLITMLPSILLSGFVFPISSMPFLIQLVTYIVPARYFLEALRTLFLKPDSNILLLLDDAIFLFIFGSIFLIASAKKFKKNIE